MSLRPTRTEWPLGQDKHQRTVTLIREIDGGQDIWRLHREAASQRDETIDLRDMTPGMLVAIGKIAAQEVKGAGQ